jgi:parvulin-like peptidyl-prolyl isomerase
MGRPQRFCRVSFHAAALALAIPSKESSMKYVLAAIVGLLFASPAYAQAVVGCGAPAIATVDNNNQPKLGAAANCFDKAGAIAANAAKARRDRIVMLRRRSARFATAPTASTF